MNDLLDAFFGNRMPPHGHCYLWNDNLVTLHVVSDALITASYFSIPIALMYLVAKREDLHFNFLFQMFSVFIFACGLTHLVNIYNVWYGAYWLSGSIKALTALASVATAIIVWPVMPKALAIPSNARLRELNSQLFAESEQNRAHRIELENLSTQLQESLALRTQELEILTRTKKELEEKNDELARSNDALQQYSYITSHDLKEPLRTITSMGNMLADSAKAKLTDNELKMLDFMTDAADRMGGLIQDLHEYAALGNIAANTEDVDLDELLQDLQKDLQSKITETDATLVLNGMGRAKVNPVQFRQLLQNLIVNGIKFCPQGRLPLVEVGSLEVDDPSMLGFYVRDNGIGIPSEYHAKIFGLFERLHHRNEYEGTGMGLAICKKIVDQYRGRIQIESSGQGGTEFRIFLPDCRVMKP